MTERAKKDAKSSFNEKLFSSKELSGIGSHATIKLTRSGFTKFFSLVSKTFAYTSVRAYGSFFLSFGLLGLILRLGEYYFMNQPSVALSSLIANAVMVLISIPLLISDKPMCIKLQDIKPVGYVLFDFLSIKRNNISDTEHRAISPVLAIFLGFIPAIIGYFLPLGWVISALVLITVVSLAFSSPEFSLVFSILLLPYYSVMPLSHLAIPFMCVLTFLSFALKVMYGKRVYSFDIYDVIIIIAILILFIKGMEERVNFAEISLLIALLVAYFPASNLLVNRRLADCAVKSVIVSSVPVAVFAWIEFFTDISWLPDFSDGVSVFFTSSAGLGSYLLVSAVLTLVFAIEKKRTLKKTLNFTIFALDILTLGIVMQPMAWVCALIGALAYLLVRTRRIPSDLIFILILIPYTVFLMPSESIDRISELFGVSPLYSEKLELYRKSFAAFTDNIFFGQVTLSGKPESYNNLLGIGLHFGVFILALFVLTVMIRLRHISYYRKYVRPSLVSVSTDMSTVAIVSLTVFGTFSSLFYDRAILMLFIILFGMNASLLKTARREYEDRLGYYDLARSAETFIIDIDVEK